MIEDREERNPDADEFCKGLLRDLIKLMEWHDKERNSYLGLMLCTENYQLKLKRFADKPTKDAFWEMAQVVIDYQRRRNLAKLEKENQRTR